MRRSRFDTIQSHFAVSTLLPFVILMISTALSPLHVIGHFTRRTLPTAISPFNSCSPGYNHRDSSTQNLKRCSGGTYIHSDFAVSSAAPLCRGPSPTAISPFSVCSSTSPRGIHGDFPVADLHNYNRTAGHQMHGDFAV